MRRRRTSARASRNRSQRPAGCDSSLSLAGASWRRRELSRYVRMLCVRGYITADGLRYDSMVARRVPAGAGAARWWRDAAARGALSRGGAVGALVLLQLERALLQADDAVDDVLGVRIHGRRDDLGEVVGEEIGRMEARVARPIPPALPVLGTTGKKAEAPGTAAPNASERPSTISGTTWLRFTWRAS